MYHPNELPEYQLGLIIEWPIIRYQGLVVVKILDRLYAINKGNAICWYIERLTDVNGLLIKAPITTKELITCIRC